MSVERRAGWLFLLGNLQYLLAEALSAHLTPSYSPTRDYISHLGVGPAAH